VRRQSNIESLERTANATDTTEDFGHLLLINLDRVDAVVSRCPLNRAHGATLATEPKRDSRVLDWSGFDPHPIDLYPTNTFDQFTRPKRRQHPHPLVKDLCSCTGISRIAEGGELASSVTTETETERQSPRAKAIQRDRFPGQLDDASASQGRDHGAQTNSLRGRCNCRQHDPRI
jgi:hypothetical protein